MLVQSLFADSFVSYYPQNNNTVDANRVLVQLEKIEERISSLKSDLLRTAQAPSTAAFHPSPAGSTHPSADNTVKAAEAWATRIQHAIPSLMSGGHVVELATGSTIFLGNRSDPPSVLGCRSSSDSSGMDQLAPKTYSFASLWGPETSMADIARVLPDDSDIIR